MKGKLEIVVRCPTCYKDIKDVNIRIHPFAGNLATGEEFAIIHVTTWCETCNKNKKSPGRSFEFRVHQCR